MDVEGVALKGGENYAPTIHPAKSAPSPLLHFVAGLVEVMAMPQQGEQLSPQQTSLLRAWIDPGANRPDDGEAKELHWSLKPGTRPALPTVGLKGSRRNPIDGCIFARRQAGNLKLSPAADRRTLIRRLSFDLIGSLPTPEEVSAFLADKSALVCRRVKSYKSLHEL